MAVWHMCRTAKTTNQLGTNSLTAPRHIHVLQAPLYEVTAPLAAVILRAAAMRDGGGAVGAEVSRQRKFMPSMRLAATLIVAMLMLPGLAAAVSPSVDTTA